VSPGENTAVFRKGKTQAAPLVSLPFSGDVAKPTEGMSVDSLFGVKEGYYDSNGNYHPGNGNVNVNNDKSPNTNKNIIVNTNIQKIGSNSDYLSIVNSALAKTSDPLADKLAIYDVQGKISSLNTQNSATLLGEIGNPNNLINPRLFLQYMNWFGSNCPVDSDTCPGLSNK
jgi:hypothetical protein